MQKIFVVSPVFSSLLLLGCQSYPFESRQKEGAVGHQVTQLVATLTPVDILFVVDNSGSMFNQRANLAKNISSFISQMSQSDNDFHVGIVTTDVECNIPERDCGQGGKTSFACCALTHGSANCVDVDTNGDQKIDWSTCDGGRLRGYQSGQPVFWSRPTSAGEQNTLINDFSSTIMSLGCDGSSFESGLEAARRAINCSVYGYDANQTSRCPSANIAELNAGFIRPEADLVVIFMTDEDDCSFLDANTYLQPADPSAQTDQANHLCTPQECYAYYGQHLDQNHDGLEDWADPATLTNMSKPFFQCMGYNRRVNPPMPDDPNTYLSALIAAKGGNLQQVRAAGIVSGVANSTNQNLTLGMQASVCVETPLSPSASCGCWSASAVTTEPYNAGNFYCALTSSLNALSVAAPVNTTPNQCTMGDDGSTIAPQPGCKGLPGSRYTVFLEALAQQRRASGLQSNTLANSICLNDYEITLFAIVNDVILDNCLNIAPAPQNAQSLSVRLNENELLLVPHGSSNPGFSWGSGNMNQICLEGGLTKKIHDQLVIFVLDSVVNP